MIPFRYKNNHLVCESTNLAELAKEFGTPTYVYSKNGLLKNYRQVDTAFTETPHLTCFALKANSNPALLRLLANEGAGADVVSGGELKLALDAGFPAKKIVYASVGKTDEEIGLAIKTGILALNIESRQELEVTAEIAASLRKKAPIAIRINPDIDIEGHPYLTTGKTANKFGIAADEVLDCYRWAAEQPWLEIVGIHCHVGSMIKKVEPYIKSAQMLVEFVEDFRKNGIELQHIDIGGGLGVDYSRVLDAHGSPYLLQPKELGKALQPIMAESGCEVLFEPGRSIIAPVGVLLTKVLYVKQTKGKNFVIVDAAMNDLIRPSLYGARHEILPLHRKGGKPMLVDVVGPICESGDFLGKDMELSGVERGDYLAIMTAGAYGYTLASNYNSRPRPVEVLVDGNTSTVIREREKI